MGYARLISTTGGLLLSLASPLQAECLGPSCYDGLAALIFGGIGYGLLGLVILVMLVRAKWRKAGLKVLAAAALLAFGVPLVGLGWQAWKQYMMEGREVLGQPPVMTGRVPLMITFDRDCYQDLCAAVVRGRGSAGVYVLRDDALQGLDLKQPLPLADLAIEYWREVAGQDGPARTRMLSPSERPAVAARIDYVVIVAQAYSRSGPGAIDAVLHGMEEGDKVRFAMAPLEPAQGLLSLTDLRFDVLDISLSGRVLALPLAPYNWHYATTFTAGADVITQALCPTADGQGDDVCRNGLEW